MSARYPFVFALALLPLGACFDPGHDYAVTVTWLINGAAPTRAMCEAYQVETVRLTTWTASQEREVEAPCDRGIDLYVGDGYVEYGGFETSVAFEYGTRYDFKVAMLDADGQSVGVEYEDSFRLLLGDDQPLLLDTLELYQPEGDWAAVEGSWSLGGELPSASSCAAAGIDRIAVDATLVTSPDIDLFFSDPAEGRFDDFEDYVELGSAPCADGELSTEAVLGPGEYFIRYTALDADDFAIDSYPWSGEDPDAEAPYLVDREGVLALSSAAF